MKSKTLMVLATIIVVFAGLSFSIDDKPVAIWEEDFLFSIHHGSATLQEYAGGDEYIEIPSHMTYEDVVYPVTTLGQNSLYNQEYVTVKIPETVKTIESFAFSNNTLALELDEGNPWFTLKDGILFDSNMTALLFVPLTALTEKLVIPDSVMLLGHWALPITMSVKDVYIGAGLNNIGSNFYNLQGMESMEVHPSNKFFKVVDGVLYSRDMSVLYKRPNMLAATSFDIPKGVKTLESGSLSFSPYLDSVTLPDSLQYVLHNVFFGCNSLKSISFPDSVSYVGDCALNDCMMLESAYFGSSVKFIGNGCFLGCTSLSEIRVSPDNQYYYNSGPALMGDSGKTLKHYPMACTDESYVVPEGVTFIEFRAFYGCGLSSITLPDTLINMDADVFMCCGRLESVTIGKGLMELPANTFNQCVSLESIEIPGNVLLIDTNAFKACSSLTSITLNEGLVSIETESFLDTGIEVLNIPSSVAYFDNPGPMPRLKKITVAEENEYFKVKDEALLTSDGKTLLLYPCASSETTYSIPEGVVWLSEYAFAESRNLQSVILPESLEQIGLGTFAYCTALQSIIIPDNVSWVASLAFFECNSLKSVEFGESLDLISEYAFLMCSSLTDVTFKGKNPPMRGLDVFQVGTETIPVVITVRSTFESGFLDDAGGDYTTFVYLPL